MSDTVIKIENLKKQYKLGAIGGQTLRAELQSWWARKRGKEDPNVKIGSDSSNYGESFYALKGLNIEIKKGEAVGIIGSWIGSSVLGNWGWKVSDFYVFPALIGAVVLILVVSFIMKAMRKAT